MALEPDRHFAEVAPDYATYRPRYPAGLYRWLASIVPSHWLVWDAGTGNGQAALALAEHFEQVLATDLSAEQVGLASPHPRITYRASPAEASGLPNASADLVTVAQALHWFDTAAFFREVTRVLVPGGVIAAWAYGVVKCDEPNVGRILHDFYYNVIGPWWPANRKLVEEGYRSVKFPFTKIDPPGFSMQVSWTLPELTGYVATWSAVGRFRAEKLEDPVVPLKESLEKPWGDPALRRLIYWPLSLLTGRS